MARDDETKVIAVYLEGCPNGEKLEQALSMAYEVGKPVVIQKVGQGVVVLDTQIVTKHAATT